MCRSRLYTHQMHVLYGRCTVHDIQLLLESFGRAPSDHLYRCLYNATSMGIRCVLSFRKQKMRLPSCFSLSSPCLLSLNRPRSHGCSWPPFSSVGRCWTRRSRYFSARRDRSTQAPSKMASGPSDYLPWDQRRSSLAKPSSYARFYAVSSSWPAWWTFFRSRSHIMTYITSIDTT